MNSRQAKRQEQRRKILFLIDHNLVTRRQPSEDEVQTMFTAIEKKGAGQFGIARLSQLNINGYYPIKKYCHRKHFSKFQGSTHISLVSYAARLGRDRIIHSLIRGGVNPFQHEIDLASPSSDLNDEMLESYEEHSHLNIEKERFNQILRYIQELPPAYFLWIIRLNDQLRQNFYHIYSNESRIEKILKCSLCQSEQTENNKFEFLAFKPCDDIVCNSCYWANIENLEVSCVQCNKNNDFLDIDSLFDPDSFCISCGFKINPFLHEPENSFNSNKVKQNLLLLPPEECKERSFQLWEALNQTSTSKNKVEKGQEKDIEHYEETLSTKEGNDIIEKGRKDKRPQFKAVPLHEVTGFLVGTSQEKRTANLFRAADRGQLRRIAVLIEKGVNIDEQDEYGQTALFRAAWRGNKSLVQLLLHAGADADKTDTVGCTAMYAALCAGNVGISELLDLHTKNRNEKYSLPDKEMFSFLPKEENLVVSRTNSDLLEFEYLKYLEFSFLYDEDKRLEGNSDLGKNGEKMEILRGNNKDPSVFTVLIPPYYEKIEKEKGLSPENQNMYKIGKSSGIDKTNEGSNKNGGSFLMDNIYSPKLINDLLLLESRLPVAEGRQKKSREMCAERSYFCDVTNRIVEALEISIKSQLFTQYLEYSKNSKNDKNHDFLENKKIWELLHQVQVFPQMRFLNYRNSGIRLAAHVDLSRADVKTGRNSTHTLILYLTDCVGKGGQTVLLRSAKTRFKNLVTSLKTENNDDNRENNDDLYDIEAEYGAEDDQFIENDEMNDEIKNIGEIEIDTPAMVETDFSNIFGKNSKLPLNAIVAVPPIPGRLFLFPHLQPHEGWELLVPPKILLRGEVYLPALQFLQK